MTSRRPTFLALLSVAALASAASAQGPRPLRVVLFDAGGGVSRRALATAEAALDDAGLDARRATPEAIRAGALDDADAVVFTGGRMVRQARMLERAGRERVRRFVRGGGGYVGVCAGAFLALRGAARGEKVGIVAGRNVSGERWRRGTRPATVAPTDGSPPLDLHYANGPLFVAEPGDDLPPFVVLARFEDDVYRRDHGTRPGEMPGTGAVAAAGFGEGRVLLFSPNPTLAPARPELFVRAVRWTAAGGAVSEDLAWAHVFGER